MDILSNLNDIPSLWIVLPVILFAGVLLAFLFREDPAVRLRTAGLSNRGYAVCLLAAALLTGITSRFLDPKVMPWGGGDDYFIRAINLVEEGVFGTGTTPTALFPPGYSFLLLPFILVLGNSPWAFYIPNFLLLAGVSAALRAALRGLGSTERHANLAAALLLLTPNRLLSTLLPLSDVPFALLWTAAFALLLLSNRHPERRLLPIAAGIVAGGAALVRSPGLLYLVPLAAGILACRAERWSSRRVRAGLLIGGAVLVLTPWTVRNYQQWGKIIPASTNGGYNLVVGNNPTGPITWNPYCDTSSALRRLVADAGGDAWNEAQKDSFLTHEGTDYMLRTPFLTLSRGIAKIVRTLEWDGYSFGSLETYTNARRLFFPLRSEAPWDRNAAMTGQALYSFYYHAIYIFNVVVYFLMIGLTIRFLIREGRHRSPAGAVILTLAACIAIVVFFFFGLSRYKEPLGAAMVLYTAVSTFTPRSNAEGWVRRDPTG